MVDTPAQITPGVYELTEIDIETFAGTPRTIYISNDEERLIFPQEEVRAFRVVEEPKGDPIIMSLNIK
jgi:kynurenine formamidase